MAIDDFLDVERQVAAELQDNGWDVRRDGERHLVSVKDIPHIDLRVLLAFEEYDTELPLPLRLKFPINERKRFTGVYSSTKEHFDMVAVYHDGFFLGVLMPTSAGEYEVPLRIVRKVGVAYASVVIKRYKFLGDSSAIAR